MQMQKQTNQVRQTRASVQAQSPIQPSIRTPLVAMGDYHYATSPLKTPQLPPGDAVLQRVRAYRVGTSASSYKIGVKEGKIDSMQGGRSGIDISFASQEHADYYFATKKNDVGAVLDEWEFPDGAYAAIKARIARKNSKPKDVSQGVWDEVKTLPAPTNSSDKFVTENSLIAPHFPIEWIPFLEKYSKGQRVTRVTTAEAFPPEPEPPQAIDGSTRGRILFLDTQSGIDEEIDADASLDDFNSDYRDLGGYRFEPN
jgi:hypothetical protein